MNADLEVRTDPPLLVPDLFQRVTEWRAVSGSGLPFDGEGFGQTETRIRGIRVDVVIAVRPLPSVRLRLSVSGLGPIYDETEPLGKIGAHLHDLTERLHVHVHERRDGGVSGLGLGGHDTTCSSMWA